MAIFVMVMSVIAISAMVKKGIISVVSRSAMDISLMIITTNYSLRDGCMTDQFSENDIGDNHGSDYNLVLT